MQSQTGELTYQKVDTSNLPILLEAFRQIWPHKEPHPDYLEKASYSDDKANVSWLIYHDDNLVGLTGLFAFDSDEPSYDQDETIWMDWFAILPEFRRHHFGSQVLQDTIAYCRKLGRFKYFRIDTTYFPERPAVSLYDKIMPLREEYIAEGAPDEKHLIYSCSLDGSLVKPWGNRFRDADELSEGDIII